MTTDVMTREELNAEAEMSLNQLEAYLQGARALLDVALTEVPAGPAPSSALTLCEAAEEELNRTRALLNRLDMATR